MNGGARTASRRSVTATLPVATLRSADREVSLAIVTLSPPLKLCRGSAEVFVPDGSDTATALARTTHLGIGAHADDLEIMGAEAILACFGRGDRWFTGVVATDGLGAPLRGPYAALSPERLRELRRAEQRNAARLGEYSAQVFLDYPSAGVKDGQDHVVRDLEQLLSACAPSVVYTHNLADEHDTHVAVALRLLEACRRLDAARRPQRVLGCEVWRDLDWLSASARVVLDASDNEALQRSLLASFASQLESGKRYDLAVIGRRRAHATFCNRDAPDEACGLIYAMDLTPLTGATNDLIAEYVRRSIDEFRGDVLARLARLAR